MSKINAISSVRHPSCARILISFPVTMPQTYSGLSGRLRYGRALRCRGLMSEAVKAVLYYGFKDLALNSIEAFTHKANMRSKKILAKFQFQYLPDKADADNDYMVYCLRKYAFRVL
jgi:RimJ/RimL family protein N-acetyltransferase